MPELLGDDLPERPRPARMDFSPWADGRVWKFARGQDYSSTTQSFRSAVRRWARAHGYEVDCRPYPAIDEAGRPLPVTQADPVALAVRFRARRRGR
jgi:hypothetical protein